MKRFPIIALLLGLAVMWAGDVPEPGEAQVPPQVSRVVKAPRAWLGLQVSRPDESISAHLPALPPGIGFMVRSIDPGGPAEAAGLRELDVLWKMGDQMLVNEGQLAALLRLSKPDDVVVLSGFRAGKPLEVKLKLGEAPARKRPFPDELLDSAVLPGSECGGPMRVFNISGKIASYATDDGRAEVRRDGEVYKVLIQDAEEKLIYQGDLPVTGNFDEIPKEWRRRVYALRRGLDHALAGRMMPNRQPRPRVVPPAATKP